MAARTARARHAQGEVTLQVVLLTPVLLLLVLLSVQVALWYHAAQAADSAAADGATAAARFGAGAGAGAAAVVQFAAEAGVRLETERVEGQGIDMVVSATVHVPHVLPFWPSTVTRSARAPLERLTEVAGG